jgi:hypothetical protein
MVVGGGSARRVGSGSGTVERFVSIGCARASAACTHAASSSAATSSAARAVRGAGASAASRASAAHDA